MSFGPGTFTRAEGFLAHRPGPRRPQSGDALRCRSGLPHRASLVAGAGHVLGGHSFWRRSGPGLCPTRRNRPDLAELHVRRSSCSINRSVTTRGTRWRPPISPWRCALPGRPARRTKTITQALDEMPLLPYARAEQLDNPDHTGKVGARNAPQVSDDWAKPYPPSAEPFLQVAAWYRTLGDVDDSDAVLALRSEAPAGAQAITPCGLLLPGRQRAREGK